ncbi:hypothetical protein CfE428DRAFT_5527 [Chthoniobacter flavus Ellin428]|uniref:Lipoprotein n=1 Tax=Chthoniobacter flavus Ellin428 TaxID=497964 RepID=B4D9D7_9BACT|nr:hypothetical protein [Chthoniobacter flavus]EDY16898.1 hypothetical protein CfE428DRAFT_5527 [Chthoniobacter flavus Ellin428]TCO87780.1 hypothetical protein EV701_12079 [Chthoniobacter flavus]
MKLLLSILSVAAFAGCADVRTAYQKYDRSHERRVDVSYDSDSQTWDLGYTITPIHPVEGYAK